ncbi:low affinity immunoglobulin epsilon Fc receptor-like isoform X1 [Manis pentadactyla]|uniref:low affinity immunoglobulin epsilon Fc receptor-like isoform X1 n=1 Tax=Manis pentadactyla TaxID=143292 RepID=UPI00255C6F8C|nr:low affinity immunoglobulin epsilon Fc receptor-like isoform X1 [Manis pentadactyla]
MSQVSKDVSRQKGDQKAQKSRAAQMTQDMERIQAEQERLKAQGSELSQNLDGLLEDLSSLKSQSLNERRTDLGSLERLQEEVARLWIELRVSNARKRETLPPILPTVPTVPATALITVLTTEPTTVPATALTTALTTEPATVPATVLTPVPATVLTTAPTTEPATVPPTVHTTAPTAAAPLSFSSTPGSVCDTCPEKWVHFQRKCYYFGEGPKKWIQARFACENLQGRLVSIHSREEQEGLLDRPSGPGHRGGVYLDGPEAPGLYQLAARGAQQPGPGRGLRDDAELRAVERRLLRQPAGRLGV